jgi:membrane protease YdiL (CAAX protease family)
MELVSIIVIIISLFLLYFFFGILIKFLWGWLPLVVGIIFSLGFALVGGTTNAVIAIIIFIASLTSTNNWQGSNLYFKIEEKIDSMFYFKD